MSDDEVDLTPPSIDPHDSPTVLVPIEPMRQDGDMRTLADLATEAIQIQQAVNLSGLVFGWAKAMKRFNELLPGCVGEERNHHPIHQMWASALADLAGIRQDSMDGSYVKAYNACRALEKD